MGDSVPPSPVAIPPHLAHCKGRFTASPFPEGRDSREYIETFANTSMLNRNGLKPPGAVVGPDDQGLWWPTLPPRPSVDEVEQRKRPQEEAGKPELIKDVKYKLTYGVGNTQNTLPTNYDVYRQVVKAYPQKTPLELTLGVNDNSVEKAEPVSK
ncbi:hypothetical protein [Nostoc sp. ATCC 53789]|uniref:hypothetical protein n=1 Tax=Nostoc sp. ATCC 53789 TaxID=76335 RepID=UPI001FD7E504|nr:hypothetical protein [Nostoc sp. ATCC 53789]